ncbi:MAG: hypothetical protein JWM85_3167 [Acidimicrobiaceae bacterium]|nr:hypothetical protein [Acidimicrobiaceae bacterium]
MPTPLVAPLARVVEDLQHGRFQRTMSGIAALSAGITAIEIFLEHDRASFANRMMWLPIVADALAVGGGIAGVANASMARRVLPLTSAVVVANGLQGTYLHARGIAQRPGGWRLWRYNAEMGPPPIAPMLQAMVGGIGLFASLRRREDG